MFDISAEGYDSPDKKYKISDIYFEKNTLTVKIVDNAEHYLDLKNPNFAIKFNDRAIGLIDRSVNEYKEKHIKMLYSYMSSGRSIRSYLCDYCTLGHLVSQLPTNFECLMGELTSDDIVHNRIVANVASNAKKSNKFVSLSTPHKNRIIDLTVGDTLVEVKIITGIYLLKPADMINLIKKIKKIAKKGLNQSSRSGCVLIGFWSKNANDFLRIALRDYCHTGLPKFVPEKHYLALEHFNSLGFEYVSNVNMSRIRHMCDPKLLDGGTFLNIGKHSTIDRNLCPAQRRISSGDTTLDITLSSLEFT